jgi:transposase
MRDNDGRKIDHKALEVLRHRALDRVEAGADPREVSRVLGLHVNTVYKWVAAARAGGRGALDAKPVPGRPPLLTVDQQAQVVEWVTGSDPRQLSFGFALWTRGMVGDLIARRFQVRMSASAVGRMLHRLGLTPQRPVWRAWQADDAAVAAWKDTVYPELAKEAKKLGATIYFADEAGLRSDHHAGTTWGIIGQTPVVKSTGARHSLNMISAVTAKGLLRWSTYSGSLTTSIFTDFCTRLMHDTDGPVFLVVDGHPTHRSKAVRDFVDTTDGGLRLIRLPGYSPQLNPDEWVWKNIKNDRVGRAGVTGPDQFKTLATSALRRLQNMPHIVRGFFRDPNLAYINAITT